MGRKKGVAGSRMRGVTGTGHLIESRSPGLEDSGLASSCIRRWSGILLRCPHRFSQTQYPQ